MSSLTLAEYTIVVVPHTPEGIQGIIGKAFGDYLEKRAGYNLRYFYKPGGASIKGTSWFVKNCKRCLLSGNITKIASSYAQRKTSKKLRWDFNKHIRPVGGMLRDVNVIAVRAGDPVKSIKDAAAKGYLMGYVNHFGADHPLRVGLGECYNLKQMWISGRAELMRAFRANEIQMVSRPLSSMLRFPKLWRPIILADNRVHSWPRVKGMKSIAMLKGCNLPTSRTLRAIAVSKDWSKLEYQRLMVSMARAQKSKEIRQFFKKIGISSEFASFELGEHKINAAFINPVLGAFLKARSGKNL